MPRERRPLLAALLCLAVVALPLAAPAAERVVDIPTRPGVTERLLVGLPEGKPAATVILFAGGHGGLHVRDDGTLSWGKNNFLVRTRQRWWPRGIATGVLDVPSDRQVLDSFRSSRDHAIDVGAVVRWARRELGAPVWLVGTSRGTISAANAAAALAGTPEGPDGVVLTSSVLEPGHDTGVLDLDLGRIRAPVLVVHHRDDGCPACPPSLLPRLERKLEHAARREVVVVTGGVSAGHPCEALAHHGYNGIEGEVMDRMVRFVLGSQGP